MLNFIYQYICNIFDKLFNKVKIEPNDDIVSDLSWDSLSYSITGEL
jgi:hypothetical protein